jgi:tetrapyrrole methylase family protein/MazG family protein
VTTEQHPDECGCQRVAEVMARLRAPDGCPWDRRQTHQSLVPYLIEETHETVDAIEGGDPAALKEELGDVALQIAFHSQLAAEAGAFTLDDVFHACADKLVRRHPHVFDPDAQRASTAEEVAARWEEHKRRERGDRPAPTLLDGAPKGLSALAKAHHVQRRAARVGFDWARDEDVLAKIDEEIGELREAMRGPDRSRVAHELGDLLFTVVNLARRLEVDAEAALRGSIVRFASRFAHIERAAGRSLADLAPEELDRLWEAAKAAEEAAPGSDAPAR